MLLLPVIPTRGLTFWSADDQKRAKVKLRARPKTGTGLLKFKCPVPVLGRAFFAFTLLTESSGLEPDTRRGFFSSGPVARGIACTADV